MSSMLRTFSLQFLILTITLSVTQLKIESSQASKQVCNGNPGQEKKTSTISSNSATVQGYLLKIQLRYNSKTKQKWSRACIPAGTQLYLKDKSGQVYGVYSAQINGWNYGDKVQINNKVKACAKHPSDSREFCTSFG
jgi:FlaG/FlaF family flagellin (archaellin)